MSLWGRGGIIVCFLCFFLTFLCSLSAFNSYFLCPWWLLTHADLEILGVDPAYQGRGLGSKLLKWGLSRADEEGIEVYLCSSPEGRRVYEKYGFEGKIPFALFPGREQLFMIRPNQK